MKFLRIADSSYIYTVDRPDPDPYYFTKDLKTFFVNIKNLNML